MGIDGGHDGCVPDGGALLLLHGFSNTHRCWARLLAAGAAERFDVLAPDLRGHGDASDLRPVDLDSVLADIDALAPPRFTLLGYSQGGRIALHAALDPRIAPRVTRLALIGASPGIADPIERANRRRVDTTLAAQIEGETIEAFAARWAQTPVLADLSPELAAEAHADRLHNDPAGLAAALRGLGTGALPSLWERLDTLRMPVALIAGERDEKFKALAWEMAKRIPRAQVEIVPGSGHQVHLQQPVSVLSSL
jgi:2-succinyl-6-hydroxy-2,4-cyclohexadiene-1-carboxylate synthase